MILTALSFLTGSLLLLTLDHVSQLPWLQVLASLAAATPILWIWQGRLHRAGYNRLYRLLSMLLLIAAGFGWAGWQAQQYIEQRLPESLAGKDLLLSGTVTSLVENSGRGVRRFEFAVDSQQVNAQATRLPDDFPRHLRLSWYYGKPLLPGQRWQLLLRLKPPHGFMNPGGFDYEAWLFQRNIHATGYVRKSEHNRPLPAADNTSLPVRIQGVINRLRQEMRRHISNSLHDADLAGVVQALAIGSRQAMDRQQWQTFVATGTSHLMAISGLHIGLAAAFGFAVGLFAGRRLLPVRWLLYLPAQQFATVTALLTATAYALLSGMGIPAQRALLMLFSISLAFLLRRHVRPLDTLALALLLVLILHPSSVLAPGFWFSFLAVLVIMLAYGHGLSQRPWWQQLLVLQLVLSLCLLPVSLQWFNQVSLVSPLANIVMVPYVSFTVVPVVLLAMLAWPFSEALSAWLLQLAHWLLAQVWPALQWLAQADFASAALALPSPLLLLLLLASLLVLFPGWLQSFLPAPLRTWSLWRLRLLAAPALLLLLPDYRTPIAEGNVLLDVLDVGQGTAVVVRTQHHTLVYDTGARFGERLDAGAAVVAPFLRQAGVRQLDTLVVSHGDRDHIGGAESLLQQFPPQRLIGQQIEALPMAGESCRTGQGWSWDGVDFEFLHPSDTGRYKKSNNLSCVLMIRSVGGNILLAGDIEKKVERELLRDIGRLKADILLVAHHGSKTSSSADWIAAVQPSYAVITAGYRNRYRLPARVVTRRYRQQGSEVLVTGLSGALHFELDVLDGISPPLRYRQQAARFWHHRLSSGMNDGKE